CLYFILFRHIYYFFNFTLSIFLKMENCNLCILQLFCFYTFWLCCFFIIQRNLNLTVWLYFISFFINKGNIVSKESSNLIILILCFFLKFFFNFLILVFGLFIICH